MEGARGGEWSSSSHNVIFKIASNGWSMPVISPKEVHRTGGRLDIHVVRAKNLFQARMIGKIKPFVEVKIGNVKERTSVCKAGGRNPTWGETLRFELKGTEEDLRVRAFDDSLTTTTLGTARIPLDFLIPLSMPARRPTIVSDGSGASVTRYYDESDIPARTFELGRDNRQHVAAGTVVLACLFTPYNQNVIFTGAAAGSSGSGGAGAAGGRPSVALPAPVFLSPKPSLEQKQPLPLPFGPGPVQASSPQQHPPPAAGASSPLPVVAMSSLAASAASPVIAGRRSSVGSAAGSPLAPGAGAASPASAGASPLLPAAAFAGSPGAGAVVRVPDDDEGLGLGIGSKKPKLFGRRAADFQLFGGPLEHGMRRSKSTVPVVVYVCVQYLQFHGLDVEGLFRVPGNQDKVLELKSSFEKGESVILMDAHNTAGVLKLYFRELSDPLIPFALYEDALTAAELDCGKAPPAAAVAAVPAGKPGAKPAAAPAAPMSKKELEKLRREQIRDRERKAKELARLEKEKRLRSKKTRTPDKVRQKAAAAAAAAEKQLVPQHRKVGSRPSISSFTFDEPAPRPAAGSAGPAAGAPAATAAAAPVASAAAGAGAATPSLESKESKEKPASTTRFPRLLAFLQRLPPDNYTVLSYLLSFLCNVASKSSINKMDAKNCAMVWAPNLLREHPETTVAKVVTPQSIVKEIERVKLCVQTLIEGYQELFPDGPPRPFELRHPTLGRKTVPRSDKHLRSPPSGSFKADAAASGGSGGSAASAAGGAAPVVIVTDLPMPGESKRQ